MRLKDLSPIIEPVLAATTQRNLHSSQSAMFPWYDALRYYWLSIGNALIGPGKSLIWRLSLPLRCLIFVMYLPLGMMVFMAVGYGIVAPTAIYYFILGRK